MIYGDSPTYGWMYKLVGEWVGPCQITKNGKNVDLIEIIDSA